MVRVKYTDNTGCNDSITEYPTIKEAWEAVYREIDDVAEYFSGREHRTLLFPDGAESYVTYCNERAEWKILNELERDDSACAEAFCAAIKKLAACPANLENLESYLSQHFDEWLAKYARTPEELTAEMKNFAEMRI